MSNTNAYNDQKLVGSLWVRISGKGNKFLNGIINMDDGSKLSVVAFKNNKKKNEKSPDYFIYESTPMGQKSESAAPAARPPQRRAAPAPARAPQRRVVADDPFDAEVPIDDGNTDL